MEDKNLKKISECRKRKRAFKRLADSDLSYVNEDDRAIVKLALLRSIAVEEINIKKYKEQK